MLIVSQSSCGLYCLSCILCVSFGLNSQERHCNWLYLIPRWVPLGSGVHVALSMWPEGADQLTVPRITLLA